MSWVALVAAWIIVVQSVLFGLTVGTHADHVQTDALGNVICSTHGDDDRGTSPAGHRPDCCLAGCSTMAAAAGPVPVPVDVSPPADAAAAPVQPATAATPTARRKGSPANPRAPPLMV